MVRVGGGWETLQYYILRHDPCKVKEFRRADGKPFLQCQGKYNNKKL
jgi:hypothetical protein